MINDKVQGELNLLGWLMQASIPISHCSCPMEIHQVSLFSTPYLKAVVCTQDYIIVFIVSASQCRHNSGVYQNGYSMFMLDQNIASRIHHAGICIHTFSRISSTKSILIIARIVLNVSATHFLPIKKPSLLQATLNHLSCGAT